MKKRILMVLVVLTSLCASAQKIKVEKDMVLLDGIPIAKVESQVLREYKISNLDGSYSIMAYMRVGNPFAFIEFTNEAINKSNEMNFVKYSPFNIAKSIIQTLFSKGYITANGFDIEKMNAFFNEAPAGLSAKYGYVRQDVLVAENRIANSYQLSIDDEGAIYSKKVLADNEAINANNAYSSRDVANSNGIIGYIKASFNNGVVQKYTITDLDNYETGTWFFEMGGVSGYDKSLNQEVITADKKVFVVKRYSSIIPPTYRISSDETAMNVVRKLIGNGYTLQHQGNEIQNRINENNLEISKEHAQVRQETYEKAKLNSLNLYDKKGYVIDENGQKTVGVFTIEFETMSNPSSTVSTAQETGKKLRQKDSKNPFQYYFSEKGVRFCIQNDTSDDCYVGLMCTGGGSGIVAKRMLQVDKSFYYKILYENNGYMVVVYPTDPNDYIIKIPNQEKGMYVPQENNKKLKKNIVEYFNCDSFVFENYDFKTVEGLTKALEDYKATCSK